MPATDLRLAAPLASAFRPTGPAATDTLPPKVKLVGRRMSWVLLTIE
jgi:hypothetical protein